MGRKPMNDFVLDTKGHCLICMEPVSSPLIKLGPGDPPDQTTETSVHYLTRFLKMDMRKVFKDTASIPPQLLKNVRNSKLKADLCEECLRLSEQFTKVHRKLEKVRLEVDFCLDEIKQKLMGAENKSEEETLQDVEDLLTLEVADMLRREAANQCTAMLSCPFPRVKVQNMTEERVQSEIFKITSKSRKEVPAWNEKASNSSVETANEGSQGMMRMEISKVKQERNSPNSAFDTEEEGDWNELDNYSRFGSDDEDGLQQKYADSAKVATSPPKTTISHPESLTKTLRLRKLQNKSKIKIKGCPGTKNGNSFSGIIPSPIKIPGKMGTWQDQYIKSDVTGKCNCRLCPKSYTTPTNFFHHYKGIHAKEKFKCGVCGIEYPYKYVYNVHYLSVHAGVRYQCLKCNRSFTQKQSLCQHNNSAHLGRMINCRVCSKSFTQSAHMKTHMRKFHSNKCDSQAPLK